MKNLLRTSGDRLVSVLRTRTGFLGLGPTYGQLIAGAVLEYVFKRYEERGVVRGAEQMLDEINKRQQRF
jgi:hypothetical protein